MYLSINPCSWFSLILPVLSKNNFFTVTLVSFIREQYFSGFNERKIKCIYLITYL